MPSPKAASTSKTPFGFFNDQLRRVFVAAIHDRGGEITDPALQSNSFAEFFDFPRVEVTVFAEVSMFKRVDPFQLREAGEIRIGRDHLASVLHCECR